MKKKLILQVSNSRSCDFTNSVLLHKNLKHFSLECNIEFFKYFLMVSLKKAKSKCFKIITNKSKNAGDTTPDVPPPKFHVFLEGYHS